MNQDMKMILTEFGKFRYNRLSMRMYNLGDIFQSKVDKILSDIKGVKSYSDDILVFRKKIFYKHIEQLRIVVRRLLDEGLKYNSPK